MATNRERALSEHFTLGTFLVDEHFPELAEELEPSEEVISSLTRLSGVLERLEAQFPGGWSVRSGFRDPKLNDACRKKGLPASADSLHLLGCAADCVPGAGQDLDKVFEWLSEEGRDGLELQEAVYYPNRGFIHVAVPHPSFKRPRRFILRV